jgi:hypothetical protein
MDPTISRIPPTFITPLTVENEKDLWLRIHYPHVRTVLKEAASTFDLCLLLWPHGSAPPHVNIFPCPSSCSQGDWLLMQNHLLRLLVYRDEFEAGSLSPIVASLLLESTECLPFTFTILLHLLANHHSRLHHSSSIAQHALFTLDLCPTCLPQISSDVQTIQQMLTSFTDNVYETHIRDRQPARTSTESDIFPRSVVRRVRPKQRSHTMHLRSHGKLPVSSA